MSLQEPNYNSEFIDYEVNQSFTRGRGETLEASQGNLVPGTHLGRKVTGAQSVSARRRPHDLRSRSQIEMI